MNESAVERFLSLVCLSVDKLSLKNLVLSSPMGGDVKKIRCTLLRLRGDICIQMEEQCTEGRVRQKNFSPEAFLPALEDTLAAFSHADLYDTGGSASLLRSKKGKVTLVTHGSIGAGDAAALSGNDRKKKYILTGSETFLIQLGVSDAKGRVHDKKQAKFRQINRFLELIADIQKELRGTGKLHIADLCCGKSYLSFAAYYYFTEIRKREVVMDCVDLKESVMRDCGEIAARCGFSGMHFTYGDVSAYAPDTPVDLLISLHACDTATDLVLERGIALGAKVILATPCCHRQLSREFDCAPLSFIARHPVLKYKFCDAATDALRILRLESAGYVCDAIEFTDPEDTPKNVLIRAVKRGAIDYGNAKTDRYKEAYRYLTGKEPK